MKYLIVLIGLLAAADVCSQSASYGNTYIHEEGESVVFGLHDFLRGSMGVHPGMVGTDRDGQRGYFGFSNVSIGWQGADEDNHIDGYVKHYGTAPFTFPVGDQGLYRPMATDGGGLTSAAYFRADASLATSEDFFGDALGPLPAGGPFDRTAKETGINGISEHEYWDIDSEHATKITLTWDFYSEIANLTNYDINKLTIVGWNGEEWKRIPSKVDVVRLNLDKSTPTYMGGVSSLTNGSITTLAEIVPDEYLAYTFASMDFTIVGDFVWEDMNRNGVQDPGEPPLENVMIELLDRRKNYVATTYSDENGSYYFERLLPGRYYIKSYGPTGYNITLTAQGSNSANSDLSFTGYSTPFNLRANSPNFDVDAGFYRNGSIGNYVWVDDGDGIQQDGEGTMPDIVIQLLDTDRNILASTVTDTDGSYNFTNIPPGDYLLKFVLPEELSFTRYHATHDKERDSDADPVTGMTDTIRLRSGDVISNIDMGISSPCKYDAELVMTHPTCAEDNGSIEVQISGETGPYTLQWSNGGSTPTISNLAQGEYQLMITDQEGCTRSLTAVLIEEECELVCAQLAVAAWMEGSYDYDEKLMRRHLNELGYLPGQKPSTFFGKYTEAGQPYSREPWSYFGTEGMQFDSKVKNNLNQKVDEYPYEAVDWVLISLRDDINQEYEVCTRAGLIMEDGTIEILEEDGCCPLNPLKKYHVVIEHRNHLVIMSKEALPIVDGRITHDFRTQQSYTRLFGNGQKEIEPGVFAMFAANGDQYLDGQSSVDINVGDLSEWLKENGEHSSYYFMDFDLNGDANVQDKGLYLDNIGIFTDVPKPKG